MSLPKRGTSVSRLRQFRKKEEERLTERPYIANQRGEMDRQHAIQANIHEVDRRIWWLTKGLDALNQYIQFYRSVGRQEHLNQDGNMQDETRPWRRLRPDCAEAIADADLAVGEHVTAAEGLVHPMGAYHEAIAREYDAAAAWQRRQEIGGIHCE